MSEKIEIRLLGRYVLRRGDLVEENLPQRSRLGATLLEYLILQRGKPVPAQRLIRDFWHDGRSANPENALKTMVCRLRAFLEEVSPELSACVVTGEGTYCWETREGVTVDVLEVLDLYESVGQDRQSDEYISKCRRILDLYQGDLYLPADLTMGAAEASDLHSVFLDTALGLTAALKAREAWSDILAVTDAAIQIDDTDEFLRAERLDALIHLGRTGMAEECRKPSDREMSPAEAGNGGYMTRDYRRMSQAGTILLSGMNEMRTTLSEESHVSNGPVFCGMETFQELCQIQTRVLHRLGSTMFLGMIMLGDGESVQTDSVVYKGAFAALEEILRKNLRQSDIVCKAGDYMLAVLLPAVNYQSGNTVMKRVENVFYDAFPRDRVSMYYRISPLGSAYLS